MAASVPTMALMAGELTETLWRKRRRGHETRVDAWVTPYLARRSRGVAHPVEDFLFTYYSYRPAALRRWHPGIGVTLRGVGVREFERLKHYVVDGDSAYVDTALAGTRRERIGWIRGLLAATAARAPVLGCFGLHEWAMVYNQQPDRLRHPAYPLRLSVLDTDAVVESHRITCTHHDAFRFFTDSARQLNVIQPTRETQRANEQPGCLNAAMDCYKCAYKLAPLTPYELVADCFDLAREVRQVDMRASPYDLTSLGVEPIRVETAEGKAAYIVHQRDFAARSGVLRALLIETCDAALGTGRRTYA